MPITSNVFDNKIMMSESEIESFVSILLGDFKPLVWKGFKPYDYNDVKFVYNEWNDTGMSTVVGTLRAGRSQTKAVDGVRVPDPAYAYWREELTNTFTPIREYLEAKKSAYGTVDV